MTIESRDEALNHKLSLEARQATDEEPTAAGEPRIDDLFGDAECHAHNALSETEKGHRDTALVYLRFAIRAAEEGLSAAKKMRSELE